MLFRSGAIWRYVMSGILGTVVFAGTTYKAAEHLPAGVITICMATLPLVSFFLSLALRMERATAGRIGGLALGLVGVLLIALPETSLPNPAAAIFIPLAILSVASFAVEGIVLGKYGRGGLDPLPSPLPAAPWQATHSFSNVLFPSARRFGELAKALVGAIVNEITPDAECSVARGPHAAASSDAAMTKTTGRRRIQPLMNASAECWQVFYMVEHLNGMTAVISLVARRWSWWCRVSGNSASEVHNALHVRERQPVAREGPSYDVAGLHHAEVPVDRPAS